MAPTLSDVASLIQPIHHIYTRDEVSKAPLASLFAVIIAEGSSLASRAINANKHSIAPRSNLDISYTLNKRQQAILVIPTTYAGLNAGPAPGAVVGIVLGSIAGFLLIFFLVLLLVRYVPYGPGRTEVIEEKIIRRHSSRRSSQRRGTVISEPAVVIRESRQSRRESRRSRREEETVEVHEEPSTVDEVIVEEALSSNHDDEMVEVM